MVELMERYKRYADIPISIIEAAEKKAKMSLYRQSFHIEPNSGYLNDPNGFSFFNGKYHLFYQWSPLRYVKNPDVWYQGWFHLVSEDLVHWQSVGPGLEPDSIYDTHGPYSGSAMMDNNQLLIFYTGNTRDKDWVRIPYQVIATMDKNGKISKSESPGFAGLIPGYTDHFRDPKIWKEQDTYYAIAGIQRENKTGTSMILRSDDANKWDVLGEIKTNYPNFGYMWECPDYFEIDNQGVLIFSPQGIEAENDKYQNIYQTGYLVGDPLNLETLQFNHGKFQELDLGFDFYATQTMISPDGRRILSAWMGLPEINYPTEKFGYCGCLTIPRELTLKEGKLIQQPIKELKQLRYDHKKVQKTLTSNESFILKTGAVFELEVTLEMNDSTGLRFGIRADQKNEAKTLIHIDKNKSEVVIDRSQSGATFATEYGNTRRIAENIGDEIKLQIFVDQSSIEVFINDGENVASSRIFPNDDQNYLFIETINGKSAIELDYWKLKDSNEKLKAVVYK